ncbi:hypothetical protein [Floccifex sp.]|uniref:hypothetical protein n=1 Tax=Floccifex sp. TaxID=2815810 RepID=UPI003F06F502
MNGYQTLFKEEVQNHLYPFFWQHGENHEVLEHYVDKIEQSGMKALCIEARPHPFFVQEQWFSDLDCILKKCKEKNMKMWILDDSHFPTGYANGKIKESYPQYLKTYIWNRRYDVHGPICSARIDFSLLKRRIWEKPESDIRIIGVYMAKRIESDEDEIDANTLVDITSCINPETRLLSLDVPAGAYSIFVVFETKEGKEETTKDYLNPLIKEATQILIQEVYEPHYQHYKEEFGKTIQGFFSDEPRFGNIKGTQASIGMDMPLPYRKDMEKELSFDTKYLPLLWTKANGKERDIRIQYMDFITKQYNENFTKVLADWCQEHGVYYLGHNIEDNGAHARLGYGTGHYFRGQEAMHFAGIDVIGTQIVPGMNYHHDAFSTGGANGEFFHYALAKLASSAAHLDSKKEGRCMCEAFGAYGWNEGLKTMKWIADSLMVRGINTIVPHAFNPKTFPDWDCPPHFYAHGNNPQFPYFKILDDYINRICSLFSNGNTKAQVALYYPAESEWAGNYMPIEKVCKEFTQHQINYEIVSRDYLLQSCIENHKIKIHRHSFSTLVFPYTQYLCPDLIDFLDACIQENIEIIFINQLPENYDKGCIMPLKDIDLPSICDMKPEKEVVVYEYEKDEKEIYMFFNESIEKEIEFEFHFKQNVYLYDAFKDCFYQYSEKTIHLSEYESKIFIVCNQNYECETYSPIKDYKQKTISNWIIQYEDTKIKKENPCFISQIPGLEQECGKAIYTCHIPFYENRVFLELEDVYETVNVIVNGKETGTRLCKPYIWELKDLKEDNEIVIEVINTLGTKIRDGLSSYLPIEPFGLKKANLKIEK